MKIKTKINFSVLASSLAIILFICALLIIFPDKSNSVITYIRSTIINKFSIYYLIVGLLVIGALFMISFSPIGKIRLGSQEEKPKYSNFKWGCMIFTSTMAADILFYSFHEWAYYYTSLPLDYNTLSEGQKITFASSYPMFHWGAIPWAFYLILAVAYGFMFYRRGRTRKTMSEACRPILKDNVDKAPGKIIDIIAVVGLIAGTATTFSITTPLMTGIVCRLFNLQESALITCMILAIIAVIYTVAVITGFKGISKLAVICTSLFFTLVGFVLICGGLSSFQFILESGFNGFGNMVSDFLRMATWTDPARLSAGEGVNIGNSVQGFPQQWTVFYWAYWIVWCVATPFFIAEISKGRTVRSTLLGGLGCGLLGTFTSFIVFGGYGLYNQVQGRLDVASKLISGESPSALILDIINQLPFSEIAMILLFVTMVAFYSSTFDALTYVMASYSYKNLKPDESPSKKVIVFWSIFLIFLPIALTVHDFGIFEIQSISVIAALPLSIVVILILVSFIKDVRRDLK